MPALRRDPGSGHWRTPPTCLRPGRFAREPLAVCRTTALLNARTNWPGDYVPAREAAEPSSPADSPSILQLAHGLALARVGRLCPFGPPPTRVSRAHLASPPNPPLQSVPTPASSDFVTACASDCVLREHQCAHARRCTGAQHAPLDHMVLSVADTVAQPRNVRDTHCFLVVHNGGSIYMPRRCGWLVRLKRVIPRALCGDGWPLRSFVPNRDTTQNRRIRAECSGTWHHCATGNIYFRARSKK